MVRVRSRVFRVSEPNQGQFLLRNTCSLAKKILDEIKKKIAAKACFVKKLHYFKVEIKTKNQILPIMAELQKIANFEKYDKF